MDFSLQLDQAYRQPYLHLLSQGFKICGIIILFLFCALPSVKAHQTGNAISTSQFLPQNIENLSSEEIQQVLQNKVSKPSTKNSNKEIKPEFVLESQLSSDKTEDASVNVDNGVQAAVPSVLESFYRQGYGTESTAFLKQFGYEIFTVSSERTSRLVVPNPNYLLGPGDQLRIRVWGSDIDAEFVGVLDKNGTINVPKIGIVPIAGVKFGDVEEVIRKEAEKYVQGINISVALAELRSLEIYVVGEVYIPGLHMVPPFSTVLGGLIDSGGIKKSGTLRSIQLFRGGKLAKTIDLYDLLLQGSRESDLVLQDHDVIFVPRLGSTAAIAGAVAQPAIYELNGETTAADLLQLAGNLMPQASGGRMYLRRFQDNHAFQVIDIDLSAEKNELHQIAIQNGDLLELMTLDAAWPRSIALEGQVWHPDIFSFKPGIMLSDVLTGPQLLKPGAITKHALLYRYDPKTTTYKVQSIHLEELFAGQFDLALQPHDRIKILALDEYNIHEPIRIDGAVWKTGELPYSLDMKLSDLLALAGGLKFGADSERIDISRQVIVNNQLSTEHFVVNLTESHDFVLQPYDYVFIRKIKDADTFKQVQISGEVKYPGNYRIKENEHLADLIERAGGFTDSAYLYGAQYLSADAQKVQQQALNALINDLEVRIESTLADQIATATESTDAKAIESSQGPLRRLISRLRKIKASGRVAIQLADLQTLKESDFNLVLENGDKLVIPKQVEFVSVVGAVYTPNSYLYRPHFQIKDYLSQSGGPTQSADENYTYVLKANGEVVSNAQHGQFFNQFEDLTLMPGDTIVVPEKLERLPLLMITRDIADILFKIATTAGVALSL